MGASLECRITKDRNFIIYLMGDLWDETCEDGALFAEFEPHPEMTWVEFVDGDKKIGAFSLKPMNSTTIEFHIQILREFRKDYSHLAANALHKWLSNTDNVPENYKALIAYIPDFFINVQDFAVKSGWHNSGTIKDSFSKHGSLYNINLYYKSLDELRDKWAVR